MKKTPAHKIILKNDQGFVLVLALLIMVVLIVIGVTSIKTSQTELQIAGNERAHKRTFYEADGGIEVGITLLEENIACTSGFKSSFTPGGFRGIDQFYNLNFWQNEIADAVTSGFIANKYDFNYAMADDNTTRDIRLGTSDLLPHTNLKFLGVTEFAPGSAIQMVSGYEGKGKGAASGGGSLTFQIHSQRIGVRDSESILGIHWKHIIGLELDPEPDYCN